MKSIILILVLSTSIASAQQPSEQRQHALRDLVQQDCGSCHGMTLRGGLGSSLLAKDLKDKSDTLLIQTILEGRKGTPMPPWKDFLSESEARWIVQQLLRKAL